ncbi:diacylglycerol acyltransferase [Cooperia oncophora]
MRDVLGLDFSPLTESLEEKLYTLGVVVNVFLTMPLLVLCHMLPFILAELSEFEHLVVSSGAEEALEARPGAHKLKLLTRKGFVKQALRYGASLVPVYTFGENDLYHQLDNPEGSFVRKFQTWSKKLFGVSMPLFYGRGLLQLNFGFLPHRRPLNTVVGAPITVPVVHEPTDEEVDRVHRQYCEALTELFEQHKARFGVSKETELTMV